MDYPLWYLCYKCQQHPVWQQCQECQREQRQYEQEQEQGQYKQEQDTGMDPHCVDTTNITMEGYEEKPCHSILIDVCNKVPKEQCGDEPREKCKDVMRVEEIVTDVPRQLPHQQQQLVSDKDRRLPCWSRS